MNKFIEKLYNCQQKNRSLVCVGLDPNMEKIAALNLDLLSWLKKIINAVGDHVCAFKPQIAHFSAVSAENELLSIIEYIHENYPDVPVILDAKRGDIGTTAQKYAIEAFDKYQADAVTVNPYLGMDSLQPFLDYADKGVIALCKTSNAGSNEFQNLPLDNGQLLYEKVAHNATKHWNKNNNVLLVVGATYPQELAKIRSIVGHMPLLIPGIGAQGGDVEATLNSGLNKDKQQPGLIISSSRGIIFAGDNADNFEQQAQQACQDLNQQINSTWHSL